MAERYHICDRPASWSASNQQINSNVTRICGRVAGSPRVSRVPGEDDNPSGRKSFCLVVRSPTLTPTSAREAVIRNSQAQLPVVLDSAPHSRPARPSARLVLSSILLIPLLFGCADDGITTPSAGQDREYIVVPVPSGPIDQQVDVLDVFFGCPAAGSVVQSVTPGVSEWHKVSAYLSAGTGNENAPITLEIRSAPDGPVIASATSNLPGYIDWVDFDFSPGLAVVPGVAVFLRIDIPDDVDTDDDNDGLSDDDEIAFGTDPLNADSDGDGISDSADPGTVAGVMAALPVGAFHSGGNQTAMLARLANVEASIKAGDTDGARDALMNLRLHMDGCEAGASADMNDWIEDCAAAATTGSVIRSGWSATGSAAVSRPSALQFRGSQPGLVLIPGAS